MTLSDINEWHKWRSDGIGGSDIPVLFGLCEYRNRDQLVKEKVERTHDEGRTYIQELGHRWELYIRNKIFLENMIDYQPKLFVSGHYPFMRVSLDGWDQNTKTLIEVKMTGKAKYEMLEKQEVPDKFMYQIQYQLMVSGAHMAYLWAVKFKRGEEMGECLCQCVFPNIGIQRKIVSEVLKVWKEIKTKREEKK